VCHFSFLQEFWNTGIGITREIETHDYFLPPSNFSQFPFFILIKKDYLCAVVLGRAKRPEGQASKETRTDDKKMDQ
jgi:fucose permease